MGLDPKTINMTKDQSTVTLSTSTGVSNGLAQSEPPEQQEGQQWPGKAPLWEETSSRSTGFSSVLAAPGSLWLFSLDVTDSL